MKLTIGPQLVLATHNEGKLREFQDLLLPLRIEVLGAGALGLPEPEETGETFAENALIKARAGLAATGLPTLADDSGLCVAALGDAPGIHTARWCGPEKSPMTGMMRVHTSLGDLTDRSAAFVCVLALALPHGGEEVIEGRCEGAIIWPPRGALGHGYDPCFVPQGHKRTFGEMDSAEKHALSHRGRAMEKLLARLGGSA